MHNIVTSGVGVFGPNMGWETKSEICGVEVRFCRNKNSFREIETSSIFFSILMYDRKRTRYCANEYIKTIFGIK